MTTTAHTAPFDLSRSGVTGGEILGQPERWAETARIVAGARPALAALLEPMLAEGDVRIVLTGAGTSAFVGLVTAPHLARTTGRRFEAVSTTDLVADPAGCLAEDVPTIVVSFARSGNSPESVAATDLADQLLTRVRHLIVTCDANGLLARHHSGREHSLVLPMPVGCNDQGFAMTSSFTSMLLAALQVFLGDGAIPTDVLAAATAEVLSDEAGHVRRCAATEYDRIVYLGSGSLAGAARESALKLLELTSGRINTSFDTPLGFRHGPKSVVDGSTLVVVLVADDSYTRQYDVDLVTELVTDGVGDVLVVATSPLADDLAVPTVVLPQLAGLPSALLAVPYVVLAQVLAIATSIRFGITPDNPSPSGIVHRVVKGVRIHPFA